MIDLNNLEGFDTIEDLHKELNRRMKAHNDGAVDDFEGLNPDEMASLHYDFPNTNTSLKINTLSEKELEQCPLLMQVRYLIDKMKGGNHIQLTKTGAIKPVLAKEIFKLGFIKDEWVEKINKESDAYSLSLTRILLQISSLAKKRHNKLSLTKKGEKLADDGNAILKELISVLFYKFNWAYSDGFESETIGKVNPAYSLYLLKKYGAKKRNADFYAELYFKAFPQLLMVDKEMSYYCYVSRTLRCYFRYFGFVQIENRKMLEPYIIKKTPFFDLCISKV